MELEDGMSGRTMAVITTLLPRIFRVKVDHPSYETWKALSDSKKKIGKKIQVSFLLISEKIFYNNNETTGRFRYSYQRLENSRFRSTNQTSENSNLTEKQRKLFQKSRKEGTKVPAWVYKRL